MTPAAAPTSSHSEPRRHSAKALLSRGEESAFSSSLEGAWIEIFKAGDYGERGAWSPQDLDQLAASYNPRLHAAPVVLGHPADDAPAYAWVRALRRAGHSLWAQLEKVDPTFEALLRAGRFLQRSVALYTHFPPTGGPYLRHLGFLGAAPPGVKGLAPVRFAAAPSVSFAFDDAAVSVQPTGFGPWGPAAEAAGLNPQNESPREVSMPEPKSKLDSFLDHLRAFFTSSAQPSPGSGDESAPADSSPVFSERLAQLEQRLDALSAEKQAAQKNLTSTESARRQEQIANFVETRSSSRAEPKAESRDARESIDNFIETLRLRGRFPPAFDRWGVPEFLERLADAATPPKGEGVILSEAKDLSEEPAPADQPLLAWFQDFLTKLPAVIEFRELGPALRSPKGAGGSRLVRFTEPRRGMTIDPASVELAERAEALAAELGITYAEALTQLREERRATPATA